MDLGSIVGGVGGLLGGMLGGLFSGADRQKALDTLEEAYNQINEVGAPPDLAKQIIYDKFNQAGLYTPQLEQTVEQHYSELGNVGEDPSLRGAQMSALDKLRNLSNVGVTATERVAMDKIRNQAARDDASRRASITQNMQARGQAGSGAELAAQLGSAQSATENESEQADRVAAEANQRALQALAQSGTMSGQIRSQDFDVNSTKARANDELNRFNVVANQNVQQRNIANINAGAKQNLAEKQRVQDLNTMQTNTERLRQRNAQQQDWINKLGLAKEKSAALTNKANVYNDKAATTQNTVGQIGNLAGNTAGSLYQYYNAPRTSNDLQIDDDETNKKKLNSLYSNKTYV